MKRIAVLLTDEFEDSEAKSPIEALRSEGMEVVVVAPETGQTYSGKKGEYSVESDLSISQASSEDFHALVIPGGASPESLRTEDGAVDLVKMFVEKKKPIATICHGPQLLISADALRGRTVTCVESIAIDVKNAGANYVDQSVVVDENLVTSRTPADLADFNREMIKLFTAVQAGV